MTRDETGKILSILKAAYPAQFKGMSFEDGTALLNHWEMELKSYPPELCTRAAQTVMRTSKYMPSIAEMLDQVKAERTNAQTKMLGDIALGRNVPIEDRQRVLGLLPGESYSPGVVKMIEALPDSEEEKEPGKKDENSYGGWTPPPLPSQEVLDLIRKQAEERKKYGHIISKPPEGGWGDRAFRKEA